MTPSGIDSLDPTAAQQSATMIAGASARDDRGRPPVEPSAPVFTRVFVVLGLAQLGQNLAILMIYTSIGLLVVTHLGLDAGVAGAIIGLLFLTSLVSRVAVGGLVDRLGPRPVGVAGAACSALGAGFYALSATGLSSSWTLGSLPVMVVPATVVLGLGYAAATTSLTTQLAHTVPVSRRAEAISYYGVFLTVGAGIGSGTGYALFDGVGAAAPFVVAATAFLASAGAWITLPRRNVPRSGHPAGIRLGIESSVLVPALAMICVVYAQATTSAFVPVAGRELGVGNPGVYFVGFSVAALLSRALVARLADRLGRLRLVASGVACHVTGLVLLSFAEDSFAFVASGLVIGAGVATLQSALQTIAIDLAPAERRGAAMATFGASFDIGVIIGSILAGQLADVLGFGPLFRMTSAVPLLGLTLVLASRRIR